MGKDASGKPGATALHVTNRVGRDKGGKMLVRRHFPRHARACPGHPRLPCAKDVDGRDEPGHDDFDY
jgi:hypothetical protein